MTQAPQQATLAPGQGSTQPFDLPGQPGFTPPPQHTEAEGPPNMVGPGQEGILEEFLREKGIDPQQGEEQQQEEQQQLILGKFKTPEDLAKAYKELERKLGQRAQQAAEQAPVSYSPEVGAAEYGEALAERFEGAEFNPFDVEAKVGRGELSLEEAAKEFAEAGGISAKAAEALLRSRVQEPVQWSDEQTQEVMNLVGGEEQFRAISQWAVENLGDEQLEPYNQAVARGDRAGIELGLRWIVAEARARQAQASASDLVEAPLVAGAPPAAGAVFQNGAQAREAMNRLDSRGRRLYDVDESYRAKVEQMIARSPNL